MKRRKQLTPAEVARSLEFQCIRPPALHRVWMVIFPDGREIERHYQVGVSLSRVLSEHAAAVAAVPAQGESI